MLALLPLLLMFAPADAAGGATPPVGKAQIFIAPSGEPFRNNGGAPYPVAAWFAGADKNGDGKIDLAEFTADFLRFFDQIDTNHDGAIDSVERSAYESTVAPETMGGQSLMETQWAQDDADVAGKSGFANSDDQGAITITPTKPLYGSNPTGAARFDLLGLPEPVAAMDTELRGRISRSVATEAAQLRFNLLDEAHRGYLTLDTLPRSYAQDHGHVGRAKKRR